MELKFLKEDFALNGLNTEEKRSLLLATYFNNNSVLVAVNNPYSDKPMPARAKNLLELLDGHLTGKASEVFALSYQKIEKKNFRVGVYSIIPGRSDCMNVCIDLDGDGHKHPLQNPEQVVIEIAKKCKSLGLNFYIEKSKSGTGFHLWIFFEKFLDAKKARDIGRIISQGDFPLATGGIADTGTGKGIEIFPKQNSVALGSYGNLVWLPWYHRANPGNNCFYKLGEE